MYVYMQKEVIVLSDPRLISPMLDGFSLGSSMSCHGGVSCYPAMRNDSDERYIVKTISIPASQVQLDALLLTGAYPDEEAAKGYFQELVKDIRDEVEILDRLSAQRGFLPYTKYQIVPMEEGVGYEVFLLSPYKRSLERQFRTHPLTHLAAVNMGIDLCAALSVCREAGYLYADLKPENVFLSGNQEYLIGDLGFLGLSSLKYASLPDRYRSRYIPPEIEDAYATLNTTMDTYALGLILYQVYNNGQLPFDSDESRKALMDQMASGEPMPPPAYADYEMAEIILKACAFRPEDRWTDPKEMGHALIAYMQRNAVNDVPIIPPVIEPPVLEPEQPEDEAVPENELTEEAPSEAADPSDAVEDAADADTEDAVEEGGAERDDDAEAPQSEEADETEDGDWIDRMSTILAEDEASQQDAADDEPTLRELLETDDEEPEEPDAEALTGEAAEILSQAQELIEHETPEPAVAPEPIDIPMPEPIVLTDEADEDNADAPSAEPESEESAQDPEADDTEGDDAGRAKPKVKKIMIGILSVILAAAVLYGGYYAVTNYYLVPIAEFEVAGRDDVLTVTVQTDRDESLITVVCKDNFGNVERAPVENGQATFKALTPGSQYLVTLEVEKFHKLTGQINEKTYSTPPRTQVASLAATAGPEDGSAIINFAVEGPDSKAWTLHYSAEGEEEKTMDFSGHTATVKGLTLGKSYTFRLTAGDDVFLIGENSIQFFSGELIYAENVNVFSTDDGNLTATWAAPAGAKVDSWTVRCYNEDGYDQTQEVTSGQAVFTETSVSSPYTLEITASGMSESVTTNVSANPITITSLTAEVSGNSVNVNWEYQGAAPENGWVISYTADGGSYQQTVKSDSTSATISSLAPGSHYEIAIQTADQTSVFGPKASADIAGITTEFSGYRLKASDFKITTYRGPEKDSWGRGDLGNSTTTFAPGSKMAIQYYTSSIYNLSSKKLTSMFVIRDSEGKLASMTTRTRTWDEMIDKGYCLEEIPELPSDAGSYTLEIYIDSMKFANVSFTIE